MPRRDATYYRRRQAEAYIGFDSTEVVLSRKIRTSTPGGTGYVETSVDLPPQVFRLNDIGSRQQPTRNTQGGQVANVDVDMIGSHDADVQVGDTFTTDRGQWRVVFVGIDSDVRTVCSVKYLGA